MGGNRGCAVGFAALVMGVELTAIKQATKRLHNNMSKLYSHISVGGS